MTNPVTVTEPDRSTTLDAAHCFHCGLPIPPGTNIMVSIDEVERPMCCHGCAAVSRAILDGGLQNFYRYRDRPAPQGVPVDDREWLQLQAYDKPEVQAAFVEHIDSTRRRTALMLEGLHCAACVWLNEQHLLRQPGILLAEINFATHRASIEWDSEQIKLSEILRAIRDIGYKALPYDARQFQQQLEREQRQRLKQLGVAGALGMQVMMLAVALYGGDFFGIEQQYRALFSWISLGLALPVLLYSGRSFFRAAWHNLRTRMMGMDVPVSLGLALAFAASAWATIRGSGHIYFDAVVMFIFFLLLARYVEFQARRRVSQLAEHATQNLPLAAVRIHGADGAEENVLATELQVGDRIRIRAGEVIPADATVLEGHSHANESLLTGESTPIRKGPGEPLIGGAINIDQPLIAEVSSVGSDSIWSQMAQLIDHAIHQKPGINRLVDRIAGYFIIFVLIAATATAIYWYPDPAWLTNTIAVLIVTCPCALSLATPTALAAATGSLARQGLLITNGDALESLQQVSHFVFDKTGTITSGQLRLGECRPFHDSDKPEVLQLAASLEQASEHPIARAITAAAEQPLLTVSNAHVTTGGGIEGTIEGQHYRIGSPDFIEHQCEIKLGDEVTSWLAEQQQTAVLLADDSRVLAGLVVQDQVRDDVSALIAGIKDSGKTISLVSGDHENSVRRVATETGIDHYRAQQTPKQKLQYVQQLQQQGAVVAMVGDGINDAAVLAAANVSIAIGNAAAVTKASADIIMLDNNISLLIRGLGMARKTFRIIRQNLGWAIAYNVVALPLAIGGHVAPWLAAIGMSASSLLVVLNARRLTAQRLSG